MALEKGGRRAHFIVRARAAAAAFPGRPGGRGPSGGFFSRPEIRIVSGARGPRAAQCGSPAPSARLHPRAAPRAGVCALPACRPESAGRPRRASPSIACMLSRPRNTKGKHERAEEQSGARKKPPPHHVGVSLSRARRVLSAGN